MTRYYFVTTILPFSLLEEAIEAASSYDVTIMAIDKLDIDSFTSEDSENMQTRQDCAFIWKVRSETEEDAEDRMDNIIENAREMYDKEWEEEE